MGAVNYLRFLITGDSSQLQTEVKKAERTVSGMAEAAGRGGAGLRTVTGQMDDMAKTAGELKAATRGLPAQFTDIFVSLQGGQAPLTVLLQQGGQLKDMFGGIGPAAKAMGGYLLNLISIKAALAVAVIALGAAYYQGSAEQDKWFQAQTATGNAMGVTISELRTYAQAMDGTVGTQRAAANALAEMVSQSVAGGEQLRSYTEAAMAWESATGKAVSETAKQFKDLAKDPLTAVMQLNEGTNFLTLSVYEEIKALEEQGRTADAARVAQDAYAEALKERSDAIKDNLGSIEKAWSGVKSMAAQAWDAMLGIGRAETVQERLVKAQAKVDHLQALEPGLMERGTHAANLSRARRDLMDVQAEADAEAIKAAADAYNAQALAAQKKWNEITERHLDSSTKKKREIDEALVAAAAAGTSKDKLDLILASIDKKYEEKKPKGPSTVAAQRGLDLSGIQAAMRREVALINQAQREIDLQHQAGLMSDADYYAQKRALIEQAGEVEIKAFAEQERRLMAEQSKGNDALRAQKQLGEVRAQKEIKELDIKNKLAAVNQQSIQAAQRQQFALEGLAATHARYLEQLEKQASRQAAAFGMGDKQRERAQAEWAIEDKYLEEQRRLEDQRMFTPNLSEGQREQIDMRLQLLEVEKQHELKVHKDSYAQLDELMASWQVGAARSWQNYVNDAADVAAQVGDLFTGAFRGMEDALVSFAMTGKADFKSLAESIIADLIRIQVRASMVKLLGGAGSSGGAGGLLGSLFNAGMKLLTGGGSGAETTPVKLASSGLPVDLGVLDPPKRRHGGPVSAGDMYEVNETGDPELLNLGNRQLLMMGRQSGYVTPLSGAGYANGAAHGGSRSGGVEVHVYNYAGVQVEQSSRTDSSGKEIVDVVVKRAVSAVASQMATDSGEVGQAMRARKQMGIV